MNTGLRGVTIASTKISHVDGAAGKLIYRGYLAKDLAGKVSFEEVAYLLLYEKLPDEEELKHFVSLLSKERDIPQHLVSTMQNSPKDALPMDVLQSAVSILAQYDPDIRSTTREGADRMAIRLIAKFPTIVAYWDRIRNDKPVIAPNPDLSHAANFLYMLNGEIPDDEFDQLFRCLPGAACRTFL